MSASQVARDDPIRTFLKDIGSSEASSDWVVVSHILAGLPDIVAQICKAHMSMTDIVKMRSTLKECIERYIDSMILLMIRDTKKNKPDQLKSLLLSIVEMFPDVLRIKKLRPMPITEIKPFIDKFRKLLQPSDGEHLLHSTNVKYNEAVENFESQVKNNFGKRRDGEACEELMKNYFLVFIDELSSKNGVISSIIGSIRRNMSRTYEGGQMMFCERFYERLLEYDVTSAMPASDLVCNVVMDMY